MDSINSVNIDGSEMVAGVATVGGDEIDVGGDSRAGAVGRAAAAAGRGRERGGGATLTADDDDDAASDLGGGGSAAAARGRDDGIGGRPVSILVAIFLLR